MHNDNPLKSVLWKLTAEPLEEMQLKTIGVAIAHHDVRADIARNHVEIYDNEDYDESSVLYVITTTILLGMEPKEARVVLDAQCELVAQQEAERVGAQN